MIIGVSGKARSGKGEFADVGKKRFRAIELSFAAALKKEVSIFLDTLEVDYTLDNLFGSNEDKEQTFHLDSKQFYIIETMSDLLFDIICCNVNEKNCMSFRTLMQIWGTEFRRDEDDNYWVKKVLDGLCEDELYIISDVRFKNEAKGILDAGGYLIRVERPDRPRISNENHPSECDLDDWKQWYLILKNDSTIDIYRQKCLGTIMTLNFKEMGLSS